MYVNILYFFRLDFHFTFPFLLSLIYLLFQERGRIAVRPLVIALDGKSGKSFLFPTLEKNALENRSGDFPTVQQGTKNNK